LAIKQKLNLRKGIYKKKTRWNGLDHLGQNQRFYSFLKCFSLAFLARRTREDWPFTLYKNKFKGLSFWPA
jgi:hypothetical protein